MKKLLNFLAYALVVFLILIAGCKVKDSTPPASTSGGGGTTGTLGTPATVQVTLSSSAIASGGSAVVTATVTDASANVVPNISVSFSVISSTYGSFTPALAVTNASGQATTQFNAAAVNATATIRASITVGSSTISGSTPITIGTPPRVPTSVLVSLSSATTPSTGGSITVTATVSDASGPISGVTVSFSVSNAAAGSLSASTATTNASGVATVTFTANPGNTYVDIKATLGSLNNSATLQIGTPPPPAAASMTITINPLSIGIASQAAVNVTLLDSGGNPAFGSPVTLTITSGAALASFSTGTTINLTANTSGIASTTINSGSSSGAVTVTATSGALTPASASFFITSDPATITLSVVNSNLINGQTTNIAATVRNVLNNPVTDGTVVNFAITSQGTPAGKLSSTSASTINGVASVTFTADPTITGGVIIQATVGTLSPVQTIIIVNAAQAGSLEFVDANPTVVNIAGAGISDSVVKFKVRSSAGVALANQNVNFQIINGPIDATLDSGGATSSGSTDSNGVVTTIVHAGLVAGPVRILASTNVPGPPATTLYASSGALSIGGGVPSYKWLSISVERFNLDGLNCDNVTSTIYVNMADRFGNYNILKNTSVSFATDYGAIDTSNITNDMGQTSSVFRTQAPRPIINGRVTILIQTTGEENFTDNDANGVYNSGDGFSLATDDLSEPFIDSDNSGSWNSGELFFDWPASVPGATAGVYNNPGNAGNGVWDASIPIWKTVNVWMTGPPYAGATQSRVACCIPGSSPCSLTQTSISIPKGSSTACYVYAADVNGNALIGGTKVSLSADKTDAGIKLYSGNDTLVDHAVNGPEIVGFTVANNTSSASSVTTALSATIDWPGKCGALKVTIPYPGTVTLTP